MSTFLPPSAPSAIPAATAAQAREAAQASHAMRLSEGMGDEYMQAREWAETEQARLIVLLGGKRPTVRIPRSKQVLPFHGRALRDVCRKPAGRRA